MLFRSLIALDGREHAFEQGLPLLEGVLATIECDKQAETPAGDHTVFIGIVTGGSVTDRKPLLYYRGGYASLSSG